MINKELITELECGATGRYLSEVPYNVSPRRLYTSFDLFDVFHMGESDSIQQCFDMRVYNHVVKTGVMPHNNKEMMARSLHDYHMRKAVNTFLAAYDQKQVVGIMGGHSVLRTDPDYRKAALIAKQLTERGYLMISGGGPGAMEATHFGAWMAGRSMEEFDEALSILSAAVSYKDVEWYDTALIVKTRFLQTGPYVSLAVPTWFYGHEPSAFFATHIAKFFDNSIREDLLLTESYGGLIVMPGSAGTVQEIFQDAVQNHYNLFGFASPVILVGRDYWTNEVPVYPFFQHMIERGHYKNMLVDAADDAQEIIDDIVRFGGR